MSHPLPAISTVPSLPTTARASILDALFEPSTQLHTLSLDLLHNETFESYDALITAVGSHLSALLESSSTSDTTWLDAIIAAHPRLGESNVASAQSRAEQAQLSSKPAGEADGDGRGSEVKDVTAQLRSLNQEYERVFGGLKYVVFVNGHPRPEIINDMRRRIERGDLQREREDAITALCEIARDRARKLGAKR